MDIVADDAFKGEAADAFEILQNAGTKPQHRE